MTSYSVPPQNLSAIGLTMTALSRRHAAEQCNFADLTRVARLSLVTWGVMALGSAGCLVTESPEFTAPKRTRPLLTNLDPPTEAVQTVPRVAGTTNTYVVDRTIKFDILSEDLGKGVEALVIVDFEGLQSSAFPKTTCNLITIPAGTMQSPRRGPYTCDLDLNKIVPRVEPGCHPITVVATHDFVTASARPIDDQDVDVATWFYQVGFDENAPDSVYEACIPTRRPGDAGADARVDGGGL